MCLYVLARRDHQQGPAGFTFSEVDDDDAEFRLVDSSKSNRSKLNMKFRTRGGPRQPGFSRPFTPNTQSRQGPSQRGRQQHMRGGGGGGFQQRGGRGGGQQAFRQGGGGGGFGSRRHMGDSRRFDVSINVNPEWGDPVELWEFSKLTKTRETVQFPQDCPVLLECGKVGYYNVDLAKVISPKSERTLMRNFNTDRTFLKPTSSEDPNFRKFASEGSGNVFLTDSMLSAIMAMPRSLYSWHLVVTKSNGQIWFDRTNARFDSVTVNENASEPPDNNESEPLNTPQRLSAEALAVQNNFSQQMLVKDKSYSLPYTSPFATEANAATLAPVGYRYTAMPVGDKYTVVVRAEIDAAKVTKSGSGEGEIEYVSVKTLNEYDAKVTGDWRKKIEMQRSGVLATEMKHNMFKIQRWAVQALMAGASTIEVGFVTRQQPKDSSVHSILSVQTYTPQEFLTGMNVNLDSMWSIVKLVLDRISSEEDGKFLLYKDPGIPNAKLFRIPQASASSLPFGSFPSSIHIRFPLVVALRYSSPHILSDYSQRSGSNSDLATSLLSVTHSSSPLR